MGKNPNSYEKKRREVEKKFKAEEKRKARIKKKLGPPAAAPPIVGVGNSLESPEAPQD
jgi:hypothetical protein